MQRALAGRSVLQKVGPPNFCWCFRNKVLLSWILVSWLSVCWSTVTFFKGSWAFSPNSCCIPLPFPARHHLHNAFHLALSPAFLLSSSYSCALLHVWRIICFPLTSTLFSQITRATCQRRIKDSRPRMLPVPKVMTSTIST